MTRSPMNHGTRRTLVLMNTRTFLATAFLAVATLAIPFQAQAISVRQYESETNKQKATDQTEAIYKIMADVAKVNPALSQAIHDYFFVTPPGQPDPSGYIAFEYDLDDVETLADQGNADLDKVQIEGLLLGIVKRDVVPRFTTNIPWSPAAPATPFREAMSLQQYESESKYRQITDESLMIIRITAEVAKVNPAISKAIDDYFSVVPPGQQVPPGMFQFEAALRAVDNLVAQGKFDRDKVKIKGILLDLIKTDVMPKFGQTAPPAPPAQ
jgi:hypothetical protein